VKTSFGIWALGPVATRVDGDELRAAPAEKDAVRAYELVHGTLGGQ